MTLRKQTNALEGDQRVITQQARIEAMRRKFAHDVYVKREGAAAAALLLQ